MQAVAVKEEEVREAEEAPSFCGACSKSLEGIDWERCHVCNLVVCPSCDVRGKIPHKAACIQHA